MNNTILIVGGGPAGCAAAISLLKNKHKVLLLEKGEVDRDKACGDSLIPDAQHALEKLGLLNKVAEQSRLSTLLQLHSVRNKVIPLKCFIYTLPRKILDQLLRDEVERLGGAVVYQSSVTKITYSEDSVTALTTAGKTYKGNCVLLATGARAELAASLGFNVADATIAAYRGYAENTIGAQDIHIWVDELLTPGYGWIFPLPNNCLNIGVGYYLKQRPDTNLPRLFNVFLEKVEKKYGKQLSFKEAPKGWIIRSGLSRGRMSGDRTLLLGENIDTTFNTTGEGVGKALQSGIIAAETIIACKEDYSEDKLKRYDTEIQRQFTDFHDAYNAGLNIARSKMYITLITYMLSFSPKLRHTFEQVLAEKDNPRKLFSIKELLYALI